MEVVGDDEEQQEEEENQRVVKMPTVSSLYSGKQVQTKQKKTLLIVDSSSKVIFLHSMLPGKRCRTKKTVPEITVVSLDVPDSEKEVSTNPGAC